MTEPREQGPEQPRPTIRDRRRIDPDTYQVREPQETAAPSAGQGRGQGAHSQTGMRNMTQDPGLDPRQQAGPETITAPGAATDDAGQADQQDTAAQARVDQLEGLLAERTADLQRLQAEYVNYKRRVDRDRTLVRATAVEGVLRELLTALDDIARAQEHDELTGGFKAVAEQLTKVATGHGLEAYGEPGDPFDPTIHDALMHAHGGADLTGPTCVQILQRGYRMGERVLRPAAVAVAEPAEGAPADPVAGQAEQVADAVRDSAADEQS